MSRRGSRALWRPLLVYATSRLAVYLVVMGAEYRRHARVVLALKAADAAWFLRLVGEGYPKHIPLAEGGRAVESTLGFFPGYPLAIRAVHDVPGITLYGAAVIVTLLAGALAAVLFWVLTERLCDEEVADRAVALFCFFPGAIVFTIFYSEGLMMAAAAACLLSLLSRRWVLAGVLAALATATRANGLALVAACAWAAFVAIRERREWKSLAAPLLAPLGIVAFFTYLWVHTGSVMAYYRTQHDGWGERFDFGAGSAHFVRLAVQHGGKDLNALVSALGLLTATALLVVLLLRWRPPGVLTIYTLAVLGLAVGSSAVGARPRFVLTAFPLIIALAREVRGTVFTSLLGLSAMLLSIMTFIVVLTIYITP